MEDNVNYEVAEKPAFDDSLFPGRECYYRKGNRIVRSTVMHLRVDNYIDDTGVSVLETTVRVKGDRRWLCSDDVFTTPTSLMDQVIVDAEAAAAKKS
jgi:hypothetical protein